MENCWVVDANFVYEGLQQTFGDYDIALISTVKQELDKHKTAESDLLRYQARQANRFIFENYDKFRHITIEYNSEEILGKSYSNDVMDNRIVATAKALGLGILTNDLNMMATAKDFNIPVESFREDKQEYDYKGFVEKELTQTELIKLNVHHLPDNIYNLKVNQYLVLRDELGNKEIFRWNGEYHEAVNERLKFNSTALGVVQPRDAFQLIAMDSIIRNDFTMITAKAGTGKTFLALSYAMQEIEAGTKYDKIVMITNNMPAKDAFYNGLVKGSLLEKLMNSSIGNMLGSKLGSKEEVEVMIQRNQLEIIPLSDIRGWEAPEQSIVIISEGQNFSREGMKLAIQRIPENCKLIIEGDILTQVDNKLFEGRNNGMTIASEVFAGASYFGFVELQNVYRSELANRAELMTDWK